MSSKLNAAKAGEEDNCNMDMSPMIDMVFLLLIFFVVNSTAIVVKQDSAVKPPIAANAKPQKDKTGRIVVNIYNDGTLKTENGELLNNDEDIHDYIKKTKEANDPQGFKSMLHLRGDKEAVFKHARKVIAQSAKAGVIECMFATYVTDK